MDETEMATEYVKLWFEEHSVREWYERIDGTSKFRLKPIFQARWDAMLALKKEEYGKNREKDSGK